MGYRQGMHELLAITIYLLSREYTYDNDDETSVSVIFGKQYLESDAFAIFEAMMRTCKRYFGRNSNANQALLAARKNKLQEIRRQKKAMGDSDLSQKKHGVDESAANPNYMVVKGHHIQNTLLPKFDPELANYLQKLGVEPQLYMMKWVRLLFGREFHIDDVLVLWDAMFADDTTELGLMDYIILAMLEYIRGQVIGTDESTALRRLLRYPPVEDVGLFVTQALAFRDPNHPCIAAAQPNSDNKVQPHEAYGIKPKKGIHKLQFRHTPKKEKPASLPPVEQQPASAPADDMDKKLTTSCASQLTHAVDALQSELLGTRAPDVAMCHMIVAELKRIRDILTGDLPASEINNSLLRIYAAQAADDAAREPRAADQSKPVEAQAPEASSSRESDTPVREVESQPRSPVAEPSPRAVEQQVRAPEPIIKVVVPEVKPKLKKKSVFEALDSPKLDDADEIFGTKPAASGSNDSDLFGEKTKPDDAFGDNTKSKTPSTKKKKETVKATSADPFGFFDAAR